MKGIIVFLYSFFIGLCYMYGQAAYFNKDYYFDKHQAISANVYTYTNYYAGFANIIDDVNIPGIKYKWKPVYLNFDLNGDTIETKVFNNKHSVYLFKTIETYSGNYLSIGAAFLDTVNYKDDSAMVALFIHNSNGDTISVNYLLYAPNKLSNGYDIYQEADSGFVVCGITNKYSANMRAMLLRLDKDGNVLWEKTYPNAGDVYAYSLAKAADGGYLLAGVQFGGGTSGVTDAYALKTDSLGNFMWSKLYGGNGMDATLGVVAVSDGGYILSGGGRKDVNQQWFDGLLMHIDENGTVIWEKLIGNENENIFDKGVYSLSDGNYAVLGVYRDTINVNALNAWLVKFDINGNIHWQRFYNKHGGNNVNYFRDLKETPDKGFVIIGEASNFSPSFRKNLWLIKLDSMGCDIANCSVGIEEEETPVMQNKAAALLKCYPNPFTGSTQIEISLGEEESAVLQITDVTGKILIEEKVIGKAIVILSENEFLPGIYLCRLLQNGRLLAKDKLVKVN